MEKILMIKDKNDKKHKFILITQEDISNNLPTYNSFLSRKIIILKGKKKFDLKNPIIESYLYESEKAFLIDTIDLKTHKLNNLGIGTKLVSYLNEYLSGKIKFIIASCHGDGSTKFFSKMGFFHKSEISKKERLYLERIIEDDMMYAKILK